MSLGRRIGIGSLQPYRLNITCKPKNEPHIRALIVNDTTGTDIILRGVDTTRTDDGAETELTVHLLLNGNAAVHLEQLVARLSLEPGIHAVHWHTADDPSPLSVTPVLAADPTEPDGQPSERRREPAPSP